MFVVCLREHELSSACASVHEWVGCWGAVVTSGGIVNIFLEFLCHIIYVLQ